MSECLVYNTNITFLLSLNCTNNGPVLYVTEKMGSFIILFTGLHDDIFVQVEKLKNQIAEVRQVLANKDTEEPEKIKKKCDELQKSSLSLFEMAYKKVFSVNATRSANVSLCSPINKNFST